MFHLYALFLKTSGETAAMEENREHVPMQVSPVTFLTPLDSISNLLFCLFKSGMAGKKKRKDEEKPSPIDQEAQVTFLEIIHVV